MRLHLCNQAVINAPCSLVLLLIAFYGILCQAVGNKGNDLWCNDTAGAFVTGTKAGISASLAILGYRIARDAKLFSDLPLAFVFKQILLPNTIIVHNSDPHFGWHPI